MTPLVHGRRTLRRLPRGGVLGRRFSVWDAMGYHGIAWASNRGPLTVPRLKEWLRMGWPADDLSWSAPRALVAGTKCVAARAARRSRKQWSRPGAVSPCTHHHAQVSCPARHE